MSFHLSLISAAIDNLLWYFMIINMSFSGTYCAFFIYSIVLIHKENVCYARNTKDE
jgi:hypothetical protein